MVISQRHLLSDHSGTALEIFPLPMLNQDGEIDDSTLCEGSVDTPQSLGYCRTRVVAFLCGSGSTSGGSALVANSKSSATSTAK